MCLRFFLIAVFRGIVGLDAGQTDEVGIECVILPAGHVSKVGLEGVGSEDAVPLISCIRWHKVVLRKKVRSLPPLTVLLRHHSGDAKECQNQKGSDSFHTILFQATVPSGIPLRDGKC